MKVTVTTTEFAAVTSAALAPVLPNQNELLEHLHTCPTCLVNPADAAALADVPGHAGVAPATCPTCAVTSVEWGLVVAMDDVLGEMAAYESLAAALDA